MNPRLQLKTNDLAYPLEYIFSVFIITESSGKISGAFILSYLIGNLY